MYPTTGNIYKRRSIRSFRKDPISDDDLKFILSSGLSAPSGEGVHPLEIIVIKSDATKEKIKSFYEWAGFCTGSPVPADARLVDKAALHGALRSGKVAAIAMDGYYEDGGFAEFRTDRFIATPHIAARTRDAWDRTDKIAFQNIVDFFESGTGKNIVNPGYKK